MQYKYGLQLNTTCNKKEYPRKWYFEIELTDIYNIS